MIFIYRSQTWKKVWFDFNDQVSRKLQMLNLFDKEGRSNLTKNKLFLEKLLDAKDLRSICLL